MAKKTVLIVDDEDDVRNAWKRMLKLEGYAVYDAATSTDALRMCDEHAFDVVIVDFIMPGMDGLEVLRRIRKQQPLVRSILISGKLDLNVGEDEIGRQAREKAEVDCYLHKPVSNDKLKGVLAEMLGLDGVQDWKAVADSATRRVSAKATGKAAKDLKKLRKKS